MQGLIVHSFALKTYVSKQSSWLYAYWLSVNISWKSIGLITLWIHPWNSLVWAKQASFCTWQPSVRFTDWSHISPLFFKASLWIERSELRHFPGVNRFCQSHHAHMAHCICFHSMLRFPLWNHDHITVASTCSRPLAPWCRVMHLTFIFYTPVSLQSASL